MPTSTLVGAPLRPVTVKVTFLGVKGAVWHVPAWSGIAPSEAGSAGNTALGIAAGADEASTFAAVSVPPNPAKNTTAIATNAVKAVPWTNLPRNLLAFSDPSTSS